MKTSLFSMVFLLLFSAGLSAQSIYLRAGTGYGLPIATDIIGEQYLHTQVYNGVSTTNSNSDKSVTGSYGAGTNFNFALGYKFNENFIFEISTQYSISNKLKTFDKDIITDKTNPLNNWVDNNTTSESAKGLFINPSLIFSAGFGKAAPYGRFGIVFGTPKVTKDESYYYNGDGIDSTERSWEYTKGLSFGFQGAVGMNWKLNDKLDIYTELNFISMTYYAGEYNLTKEISSNGTTVYDNLPNLYLSQKQTIYKKEYDPTVAYDPAKPSVALRDGKPFSSVSLQVGIRFALWKKAE